MLTQQRATKLLGMVKELVEKTLIQFPVAGENLQLEAKSEDARESFVFDVNRRGRIKVTKCTYQERYAFVEILLRLDIDGPPHQNPDGEIIPCPHLHVYRQGFADKWAIPLPAQFTDPSNLVKTLHEFLRFCRVSHIPDIQQRAF